MGDDPIIPSPLYMRPNGCIRNQLFLRIFAGIISISFLRPIVFHFFGIVLPIICVCIIIFGIGIVVLRHLDLGDRISSSTFVTAAAIVPSNIGTVDLESVIVHGPKRNRTAGLIHQDKQIQLVLLHELTRAQGEVLPFFGRTLVFAQLYDTKGNKRMQAVVDRLNIGGDVAKPDRMPRSRIVDTIDGIDLQCKSDMRIVYQRQLEHVMKLLVELVQIVADNLLVLKILMNIILHAQEMDHVFHIVLHYRVVKYVCHIPRPMIEVELMLDRQIHIVRRFPIKPLAPPAGVILGNSLDIFRELFHEHFLFLACCIVRSIRIVGSREQILRGTLQITFLITRDIPEDLVRIALPTFRCCREVMIDHNGLEPIPVRFVELVEHRIGYTTKVGDQKDDLILRTNRFVENRLAARFEDLMQRLFYVLCTSFTDGMPDRCAMMCNMNFFPVLILILKSIGQIDQRNLKAVQCTVVDRADNMTCKTIQVVVREMEPIQNSIRILLEVLTSVECSKPLLYRSVPIIFRVVGNHSHCCILLIVYA